MNITSKQEWLENLSIALRNYEEACKDSVAQKLGLEIISVDQKEKKAVFVFQPKREHINQWGAVNGGIIALAFDMAMGMTIKGYANCQTTPTVNLNLSYLKPHKISGLIYIEVTINLCGNRLAEMSAVTWQQDKSEILAVSQGTFLLTKEILNKCH